MATRFDAEIPAGTVLGAMFRVLRPIAVGGMGAIYAATHTRLAGRYAVKVLHGSGGGENAFERFRREAEVTSALRHPHIVQVLDFHQMDDGRPYMVMEFLDGVDLRERLRQSGPLAPARAVRIVEQVASALGAAHHAGITHRDLKPENLFCLAAPGADEEFVKVLDFGMSKLRHASKITADAALIGTPPYMAPEQAAAQQDQIGPATDQFALAAIFYEMLTGQVAFRGNTPTEVLAAVIHREPQPIPDPRLGPYEPVVRKGLSKARERRYPDIAAFAQAVRAAAR